MSKSKNKKIFIILTAILLIIILLIAGIFLYLKFNKPVEDSDGVVGVISSGWDANVEQSSHEEGKINIPGYGTAQMNEGDKSLKISIGNPKDNNCGFIATVKLEDGTVLYKSELLKPGYGLTEVPVSKSLKKGKYKAEVCYNCVTLDEKHSPLNSAESGFTLIIK